MEKKYKASSSCSSVPERYRRQGHCALAAWVISMGWETWGESEAGQVTDPWLSNRNMRYQREYSESSEFPTRVLCSPGWPQLLSS